jgi:hypothetical protein
VRRLLGHVVTDKGASRTSRSRPYATPVGPLASGRCQLGRGGGQCLGQVPVGGDVESDESEQPLPRGDDLNPRDAIGEVRALRDGGVVVVAPAAGVVLPAR